MMKNKWIFFLILAFILTSCGASTATAVPLKMENAASSGPTGLSTVQVSDGVVLLTPGQETAAALPTGESAGAAGFASAAATPTLNPANVELPEGIPIYPGAQNLQVPTGPDPTGMGIKYFIFYTTDSTDQVVKFYMDKAAAAGWSVTSTETEPDSTGMLSQLWAKDDVLLILQTWQPVNGLMKVQISWM